MKANIKALIMKHYPPVVLFLLISISFILMCVLLNVIEFMTTDLPIQYR